MFMCRGGTGFELITTPLQGQKIIIFFCTLCELNDRYTDGHSVASGLYTFEAL